MQIIDSPPELPLALDNNVFTHLRNKQHYVLERIKIHFKNTKRLPVIPSTTVFEANFGIHKELANSRISDEFAHDQFQEIGRLLISHEVISFNQRAAEIAAHVFARLPQSDRNKHWRNIYVAATAIAHNFGLVTQNRRDMELIAQKLPPNVVLRLSNWKS